MPKKKASPSRTTVRLPDDIHHKAKIACAQVGLTLQEFVAEAVIVRLRALDSELKRKQA